MFRLSTKQLSCLIVIAAFLLQLPELLITLSYDEIWTFTNFARLPVSDIFFDLSLPNNHPLNTLLVKIVSLAPLPPECIRIPSLLAGIGSILLAGVVGKRMGGENSALFCMLFMAFSAPLAVYSTQARGYSLQVFLLLSYTCCLINAVEKTSGKKDFPFFECGIIFSALASVMTLSTSCLYLAGITLALWNFYKFKKLPRRVLLSVAAAAAVSVIYLLLNLQNIIAARQWGEIIESFSGFIMWLANIFYRVLPWGLLPFMLWSFYCHKRFISSFGIFFLLLFGSAILTNGGPARVYLPLAALFAVTAGIGAAGLLARLKKSSQQQLFILVVIVLAAANFYFFMPDWRFADQRQIYQALEQEKHPGELTIYSAGDSYQVAWNIGSRAVERYAGELADSGNLKSLLLVNYNGSLSGLKDSFAEYNYPLHISGSVMGDCKVPVLRCTLEEFDWQNCRNGDIFLAVVPPQEEAVFKYIRQAVKKTFSNNDTLLLLNCWLVGGKLENGGKLWGGSWFIAPGETGSFARKVQSLSSYCKFYRIKVR